MSITPTEPCDCDRCPHCEVAGAPFTLAENRQALLQEMILAAQVSRAQHDRLVEYQIAYDQEMRNQRLRFVEQQNFTALALQAVVIQQIAGVATAGGSLDAGTVVSLVQELAKVAQTTPPVTAAPLKTVTTVPTATTVTTQ